MVTKAALVTGACLGAVGESGLPALAESRKAAVACRSLSMPFTPRTLVPNQSLTPSRASNFARMRAGAAIFRPHTCVRDGRAVRLVHQSKEPLGQLFGKPKYNFEQKSETWKTDFVAPAVRHQL